jgi:spore germination protein YaaH
MIKKTKLASLLLLIAFFAPNISFASENLFYYFENTHGFTNFKKNYKKIDVLAPQVYTVGDDLKVEKLSSKNKKIIKEAKKKKVKIVPLLVNKRFDKVLMSSILINPEAQDEIIDFMVKEAKKQKYAGWQFDFENINHMDRDMYTAFVKKTYERMKKENLEFSVAVVVRDREYDPVKTAEINWSSAYDYAELSKYVDFMSFMTYDDPYSYGPVASIPYLEKTLKYMNTKVPAEKVSLGIPAYCWLWSENPRKKIRSYTYELAEKAYKKGDNATRGFDNYFGAEWFRYEDGGVKYEVWCDNSKSFELKQDIVKKYGYRGISVWALGQEDKRIWKILK